MLKRSFPLFIVSALVCALCIFVPSSVAYAIDTPTYNVSFVAPDNTILYETGDYVSEGTTLADLQASNLAGNSGFVGLNGSYNRGATIYTGVYGKLVSWLINPVVITDNYALLSTSQNQVLQFLFSTIDYNNSNITASFYLSTDNINYTLYTITRLGTGNSYFSNSDFATQLYINNTGYLYWNLTVYANKDLYLKWFKIEVSDNFTGFFDTNYIDSKLASYNSNNSNYEYDYNLNAAITSDKFYYPANIVNNYELGYQDGIAYATSLYNGFGIFNNATWFLYYDSNDELVSDFTGRFNNTDFISLSGGFRIGDSLFHSIDSYLDSLDYYDSVYFRIVFDSPISLSAFYYYVPYHFQSGNSVYFYLNNGMTLFYDGDDISYDMGGVVDLSSYSFFNLLSVNIRMVNWADYGDFGLSVNATNSVSYNNGYNDGFTFGRSEGYQNGYNDGKADGVSIGYQNGVNDAGDYTFFSLISSVIDAPIRAFTSLFNFEVFGINLLNFFTGLLTLALLLWIIKLTLGGK